MKASHITQKAALFTLFFQAAAWGRDFSPEGWDLVEAVERRIGTGRADQAALDALLDGLAPDEGCAEWGDGAPWRGDPDLEAALVEVCPGSARSRRKSAAPPPRVGFAAEADVRPSGDSLPAPSLSGSLRGARGGLRLAGSAHAARRRQAWLQGPAWKAEAGHPDLAALPHLPFVSGRRSFPGGGWVAGPGGPWAASSPSLDGLAGQARAGDFQAAAFAAWNRRPANREPDLDRDPGAAPADSRQDALAYSLAADRRSSRWRGTAQAAHLRLEVPGREPAGVFLGGAEIRGLPGYRAGIAVSGFRAGSPASDSGPRAPASRAGAAEGGAYAEAAWEAGKPGGYGVEGWQASTGWASPLGGRPSLLRDTAEPGLPLPGRGEGGARLRSEIRLLEAEGLAMRLRAAATAGWALEEAPGCPAGGFLAGEGRAGFILAAGPWTGEANWGSGWRREGLPAAGVRHVLGQAVAWEGKGWRAGASWSRRETGSDAAWPAILELGRRVRGRDRWQARLSARDARFPARSWRLSADQVWSLGAGLTLSHALRLPMAAGELGEDFGYRVKLEFAGR